jgi:hypothetical protein
LWLWDEFDPRRERRYIGRTIDRRQMTGTTAQTDDEGDQGDETAAKARNRHQW